MLITQPLNVFNWCDKFLIEFEIIFRHKKTEYEKHRATCLRQVNRYLTYLRTLFVKKNVYI